MSNNIHKFALSFVTAGVILGLSGCSMVPVDPDSRLGRTTAVMGDVGGRVWTRTKHVFRISDDETVIAKNRAREAKRNSDDEFADPVDLALMDEDGQLTTEAEAAYEDTVVITAAPQQEVPMTVTASAEPSTETPLASTRELTFRTDDYTHVVQDDESLWDLSRNLTGDARNWRILAELNDLDDNGTIYPGQKLHIPADMANGKGLNHIATVKPIEEKAASDKLTIAAALPKTKAAEKSQATDAVAEVVVKNSEKRPPVPATDFGVQAGETMWDLAKRTTGDATNWKKIAAANNMTDTQASKIRYGQNISVPNDLLKKLPADSTALAAKTEVKAPAVTTVAKASTDRLTVPGSDNSNEIAENTEGKDIEIMPATFKSDPLKIPTAENAEQVAAKAQDGSTPQIQQPDQQAKAAIPATAAKPAESETETNSDWVMVSGTYYPKAVYNDANFSATLLMRVSPGTKLLVSRAIGPWYEVKTDRGIGYVHSRDVK